MAAEGRGSGEQGVWRGAWLFLLACSLSASLGSAEGARKELRCAVHRACDAAGRCEDAAGDVVFRLEPREVRSGGAGHYVVEYDGTRADVEGRSDVGPFLWESGAERHALLASSETEWLWHRLVLTPRPSATVRFMTCALEQ
jgi:hypothetical protein